MQYATIPVEFSAATSATVDLGGGSIIAVFPDASWAGTVLTFQATLDDTNYGDVYDETGTQLSYTVAASQYTVLPPDKMIGLDQIKVVSDQTETATIRLLIK